VRYLGVYIVLAKSGLVLRQTQAAQPNGDVQRLPRFRQTKFRCDNTDREGWRPMKWGSMKRKKSGQRALVAYVCFRPQTRGRLHSELHETAPVVTYDEILEEAQANAGKAIELCLEVMRQDGPRVPALDLDLAPPIEQLAPVAAR
jgi:hypothetical protein